MMEGPCADSVEKHEPASDDATVVVDSLKALDPNRPIREADSLDARAMSASREQQPLWLLRDYNRTYNRNFRGLQARRLQSLLVSIEFPDNLPEDKPTMSAWVKSEHRGTSLASVTWVRPGTDQLEA